jgi:creatinine amidohydrolase
MEIGIAAFWVIDQFFVKQFGFKEEEPHLLIHKSLIAPGSSPANLNIHAESYETSFMWHYLPESVDLEVWRTLKPTNLTMKDLLVWQKGGLVARRITPQGYFGDPTSANPETGRREMEAYGKVAAGVIEDLARGQYFPPR